VDASRAATRVSGSKPTCRRQRGQPPSGASDGISAPHFKQTLGALIIGEGSLTHSLSLYCEKYYQRLCSDTPINCTAYPRYARHADYLRKAYRSGSQFGKVAGVRSATRHGPAITSDTNQLRSVHR